MRVAVIGAGRWGRNLIRNLHDLDALHSVSDTAPAALRSLSSELRAPRFGSPAQAIASDAAAIAIATPSPSHFDIAREALVAGKDVFVEKPMAMDSRQAEALVELAETHERVLMVGHLLLFQPAIVWLRDFLRSGAIGRVVALHHDRLQFGRPRAAENALWSLGVHDVATALYLVGERPGRVSASGRPGISGVAEDVQLQLGFESAGVTAHIRASWCWPSRRRELTVVGTDGIVVYDELAQTVTHHRKRIVQRGDVRTGGDDAFVASDDGAELVFEGHGQPVRLELEHFLECLHSRRAPRADGTSGLAVVEILERADRSMGARALRA